MSKGYFPAPPGGDHCTREGAQALANKLNAWWHERGHPMVQFWVEPVVVTWRKPRSTTGISRNILWAVRSNLVRGQPPREKANAAPDVLDGLARAARESAASNHSHERETAVDPAD